MEFWTGPEGQQAWDPRFGVEVGRYGCPEERFQLEPDGLPAFSSWTIPGSRRGGVLQDYTNWAACPLPPRWPFTLDRQPGDPRKAEVPGRERKWGLLEGVTREREAESGVQREGSGQRRGPCSPSLRRVERRSQSDSYRQLEAWAARYWHSLPRKRHQEAGSWGPQAWGGQESGRWSQWGAREGGPLRQGVPSAGPPASLRRGVYPEEQRTVNPYLSLPRPQSLQRHRGPQSKENQPGRLGQRLFGQPPSYVPPPPYSSPHRTVRQQEQAEKREVKRPGHPGIDRPPSEWEQPPHGPASPPPGTCRSERESEAGEERTERKKTERPGLESWREQIGYSTWGGSSAHPKPPLGGATQAEHPRNAQVGGRPGAGEPEVSGTTKTKTKRKSPRETVFCLVSQPGDSASFPEASKSFSLPRPGSSAPPSRGGTGVGSLGGAGQEKSERASHSRDRARAGPDPSFTGGTFPQARSPPLGLGSSSSPQPGPALTDTWPAGAQQHELLRAVQREPRVPADSWDLKFQTVPRRRGRERKRAVMTGVDVSEDGTPSAPRTRGQQADGPDRPWFPLWREPSRLAQPRNSPSLQGGTGDQKVAGKPGKVRSDYYSADSKDQTHFPSQGDKSQNIYSCAKGKSPSKRCSDRSKTVRDSCLEAGKAPIDNPSESRAGHGEGQVSDRGENTEREPDSTPIRNGFLVIDATCVVVRAEFIVPPQKEHVKYSSAAPADTEPCTDSSHCPGQPESKAAALSHSPTAGGGETGDPSPSRGPQWSDLLPNHTLSNEHRETPRTRRLQEPSDRGPREVLSPLPTGPRIPANETLEERAVRILGIPLQDSGSELGGVPCPISEREPLTSKPMWLDAIEQPGVQLPVNDLRQADTWEAEQTVELSGQDACLFTAEIQLHRSSSRLVKGEDSVSGLEIAETWDSVSGLAPAETEDSVSSLETAERGDCVSGLATVETGDSVSDLETEETGDSVSSLERAETGDSVSSLETAETGDSVSALATVETGDSVSGLETAETEDSVSALETAGTGDSDSGLETAETEDSVCGLETAETDNREAPLRYTCLSLEETQELPQDKKTVCKRESLALPLLNPEEIHSSSPTPRLSHSPLLPFSSCPSNPPCPMPGSPQSHSPSLSPSQSPSLSPSQSPSRSPSLSPSQPPSLSSSQSPSQSPSLSSPSLSPSQSPSLSPSQSPYQSPSQSPSLSPSAARCHSPDTHFQGRVLRSCLLPHPPPPPLPRKWSPYPKTLREAVFRIRRHTAPDSETEEEEEWAEHWERGERMGKEVDDSEVSSFGARSEESGPQGSQSTEVRGPDETGMSEEMGSLEISRRGEELQGGMGEGPRIDVEEGLNSDMGEGLQIDVGEGLQWDVGEVLKSDMGERLQWDIGEGLQGGVGEGLQIDVGERLQRDMGACLQGDVGEGLQWSLGKRLLGSLKEELRNELGAELFGSPGEGLPEGFQGALWESLQDSLGEQIKIRAEEADALSCSSSDSHTSRDTVIMGQPASFGREEGKEDGSFGEPEARVGSRTGEMDGEMGGGVGVVGEKESPNEGSGLGGSVWDPEREQLGSPGEPEPDVFEMKSGQEEDEEESGDLGPTETGLGGGEEAGVPREGESHHSKRHPDGEEEGGLRGAVRDSSEAGAGCVDTTRGRGGAEEELAQEEGRQGESGVFSHEANEGEGGADLEGEPRGNDDREQESSSTGADGKPGEPVSAGGAGERDNEKSLGSPGRHARAPSTPLAAVTTEALDPGPQQHDSDWPTPLKDRPPCGSEGTKGGGPPTENQGALYWPQEEAANPCIAEILQQLRETERALFGGE
nr:PREDICTED: proline-rich protein 36-like [Lepisosteus oculatus]